jgi:hypothetical protein
MAIGPPESTHPSISFEYHTGDKPRLPRVFNRKVTPEIALEKLVSLFCRYFNVAYMTVSFTDSLRHHIASVTFKRAFACATAQISSSGQRNRRPSNLR